MWLGHTRLSIQDLSEHGAQPMVSGSGRLVLAFNGEIYNHLEIRARLTTGGHNFRGNSDTEVLLAAIENWGTKATIASLVGMYAFSVWDRTDRRLVLVRDRMGIKPLFYGLVGGRLVFGSELKALRQLPGFERRVNRSALASYLRYSYVPDPLTIYEGIFKLPPGHVLEVEGNSLPRLPDPQPYWSVADVAQKGLSSSFEGSDSEAVDELERLMTESVQTRMVSDVPLGAFLSGGIDSSTVVALMQKASTRPIRSFSLGFEDGAYNEAPQARSVAEHLGTDHSELMVTADDALAVIPSLPQMFDEPFADSSQIPTYLVSRFARENVTVSLSGDGADELFAGYNRHRWGPIAWQRVGHLNPRTRYIMSRALTAASPSAWDRGFRGLRHLLPNRADVRLPGEKVHKLARALAVTTDDEMYRDLASQWPDPSSIVVGGLEADAVGFAHSLDVDASFVDRMMFEDQTQYLPGDILTKVDRASMAVGLEARVPFLDHRVVEFAWQLQPQMKLRDGVSKWIVRQVLHRYVPPNLVDRPKSGFGVPIDTWLRGPLREWAAELLRPSRLREEGYLEPAPIWKAWLEHLDGKRQLHHQLWAVLMFEAWLDDQGK